MLSLSSSLNEPSQLFGAPGAGLTQVAAEWRKLDKSARDFVRRLVDPSVQPQELPCECKDQVLNVFMELDCNKDYLLTEADFNIGFGPVRQKMMDLWLKMVERFDFDGNKSINQQEFLAVFIMKALYAGQKKNGGGGGGGGGGDAMAVERRGVGLLRPAGAPAVGAAQRGADGKVDVPLVSVFAEAGRQQKEMLDMLSLEIINQLKKFTIDLTNMLS